MNEPETTDHGKNILTLLDFRRSSQAATLLPWASHLRQLSHPWPSPRSRRSAWFLTLQLSPPLSARIDRTRAPRRRDQQPCGQVPVTSRRTTAFACSIKASEPDRPCCWYPVAHRGSRISPASPAIELSSFTMRGTVVSPTT